ncbi:MAG: TraB/GumN family protein [Deltaproteobacteria bacterium]|nr:TraB/GumN family protein [Deltaproteobacteria bacterium]
MEQGTIHKVTIGGKEIILVGTAHVSAESADLVERVIAEERPDTVCVELCPARYDALMQKTAWQETDIVKIIREKRTSLLLSQLLMASIQKKLADRFNINPGEEMIRAVKKAEEVGAAVVMADRNIRTTLLRAWRSMGFISKVRLLVEGLLSIILPEEITEEDIEKLKERDVLEAALETVGQKMPVVKTILIDERDKYLASRIFEAHGARIVAVVGAGHLPGILKCIGSEIDISSLETIPSKSLAGKFAAWSIVAVVIAIVIGGFFRSGGQTTFRMIELWIAVNGILAGLGAMAVLAHPLTILSSIIAAPITSLNPMVAAGWVAGLTEASLRRPRVKDFTALREDIATVRGFWKNKITRILLVVVFVNVGSALGTFVAIPLMMRLL